MRTGPTVIFQGLYVELHLCCGGELYAVQIRHVLQGYVFGYIGVLFYELFYLLFKYLYSIAEYNSGADFHIVVVDQDGRDAQGTYGQVVFRAYICKVLLVVIHVPVDAKVRHQCNFSIGYVCYQRQLYGGTVCLDAVQEEICGILQKQSYRDLLVCVVAVYIHAYE